MSLFTPKSQLRALQLSLKEMGPYSNVHLRPYQTYLSPNHLDALQDRLPEAQWISPELIAGVAGGIVFPAPEAGPVAHIPNGWQAPRLRFMLTLEFTDAMGMMSVQKVIGYTEHDQVGVTDGKPTPRDDLLFHINSIVTLRKINRRTPTGLREELITQYVCQLLHNPQATGVYDPQALFMQRPKDVFSTMRTADIRSHGVDAFIDTSTLVQAHPHLSDYHYTSASEYLASIMRSFTASSHLTAMDNRTLVDMLEQAQHYAFEPSVYNDPFLKLLITRRMSTEQPAVSGTFTFAELKAMLPEVEQLVCEEDASIASPVAYPDAVLGEWGHNDQASYVATVVRNGVAAAMAKFGLQELSFDADNTSHANTLPHVQIKSYSAWGKTPKNVSFVLAMYLQYVLMREAARNNAFGIQLRVSADMTGETTVVVGLQDHPQVVYTSPNFCDARFSPVLSHQQREVEQLSDELYQVLQLLETDS